MATMSSKYDSEHRRAIDSMKKDRQKEEERAQAEAASTAALLESTTVKLDKAAARKNTLEREVTYCLPATLINGSLAVKAAPLQALACSSMHSRIQPRAIAKLA